MKGSLICALALATLSSAALAQQQQDNTLTSGPDIPITRVGTRGAAFLDIGIGARAQALGGAYTALAEGVSAMYWNSAGLGQLEGFAVGLSQANLFEGSDVSHTYVGAVLPLGLNRIGISVNTLTSGDMPWTDEAFPNAGHGGPVNPVRTDFEWTSTAVGLHFARPITDRLLVGAAAKYVTEGISGARATYIGADLGTIFRTGLYGITIGASLQNVGTNGKVEGRELITEVNTSGSESQLPFVRQVEFAPQTESNEMPTMFRFSIAADLIGEAASLIRADPNQNLRVMWDLNDGIGTAMQTAVGVEYAFRNIAFLRAGKRWTNEEQIEFDFARNASFGGGVRLPLGRLGAALLDYAYTGMGDLENIQVFTVELHF